MDVESCPSRHAIRRWKITVWEPLAGGEYQEDGNWWWDNQRFLILCIIKSPGDFPAMLARGFFFWWEWFHGFCHFWNIYMDWFTGNVTGNAQQKWWFPESWGYPCLSSIDRWMFHYKPSILGYPYFRKPPYHRKSMFLFSVGFPLNQSHDDGNLHHLPGRSVQKVSFRNYPYNLVEYNIDGLYP